MLGVYLIISDVLKGYSNNGRIGIWK